MRRLPSTIWLSLLFAGTALAGPKPTLAQARAVAHAWVVKAKFGGVASVSAATLFTTAWEPTECAPATSTTADDQQHAAACVAQHFRLMPALVAVDRSRLRAELANLDGLAIEHKEDLRDPGGNCRDRVFVVALERGVPKVAAATAETYFCGE
jgi:hypothetical protein